MKRFKAILGLLLALVLVISLAGCNSSENNKNGSAESTNTADGSSDKAPTLPKGDGDAVVLKIEGEGIKFPLDLSLSQIKALKDGYAEETFSARNNWPTDRSFTAKGIKFSYLLDLAGLKDEASTITVTSSDGYLAHFTREQLLEPRYSFPNLSSNSKEGAFKVDSLLAWESAGNGEAEVHGLRSFVGQCSLSDVNTAVSVKDVQTITVDTGTTETWSEPQYDIATVDGQQQITLYQEDMDSLKIYYTTDGSDPTVDSKVYNPSTSYYQPELIVPIKAPAGTEFKAFAVGFGKNPSTILSVKM